MKRLGPHAARKNAYRRALAAYRCTHHDQEKRRNRKRILLRVRNSDFCQRVLHNGIRHVVGMVQGFDV